jgi:nitrite reductase (NADH) small subunit
MSTEMSESVTPPGSTGGAPQRAGSLAQLQANGRLAPMVGGRKIALFFVDGAVIATSGRCPHARGPIHEGEVSGSTLTCPWHGYNFDLRTGACEDDPDLNLERFAVDVQGDDILVSLP